MLVILYWGIKIIGGDFTLVLFTVGLLSRLTTNYCYNHAVLVDFSSHRLVQLSLLLINPCASSHILARVCRTLASIGMVRIQLTQTWTWVMVSRWAWHSRLERAWLACKAHVCVASGLCWWTMMTTMMSSTINRSMTSLWVHHLYKEMLSTTINLILSVVLL